MKEGPVLHYLNLCIIQYALGVSVDQSENIYDLVKDWYSDGFNTNHTPLCTDSKFETELSGTPPPTPKELKGLEALYKFQYHTRLSQIQNIVTW